MAERQEHLVRNMRLVAGRRIRVLDLIGAGLLAPGDELVFSRPRIGESFRAHLTEKGTIRLPDGQEYRTPSSAAKAASGMAAVDGWAAWTLSRSGELLDTLRQRFLDSKRGSAGYASPHVEGSATSDDIESNSAANQADFLKQLRTEASNGAPRELSVRGLLAAWGAVARSGNVDTLIEDDLANYGLTTVPNFRKVALETPVLVTMISQLAESDDDAPEFAIEGDDERPDTGLTVGNLPSALQGVESVSPQSTFEEAITKMLLNDYSQLAVLAGLSNLRGAISWKSIAQARHLNHDASLADAIVPAEPVRYDTELIDVLQRLYEDDFVFVRGPQGRISGIVTAADVVLAYGDMSMPFLLVGQIDVLLRRLITRTVPIDLVIAACDPDGSRGITGFDDLTVGDYQRTLESGEVWARLRWPIDRSIFIKRLDEIRRYRNDIMHFDPDPLSQRAVVALRNFSAFLKDYVR